ncbi:F-box protein CPR1-like [Papaver somniferum]|uniref:F-box protein CPR1-like n=1 Tax=Papaver somniferum TaxID=3469 RepID=UPI000E6F707D|nr:F-box protein CPR1-like [Papaver somniferum]
MEANDSRVGSQKLLEPLKRLPEENILEILGKLPLRDLMVFRCVSKFWCFQLDNNPEFVRMTKNSYSVMLILDGRTCSLDINTLTSSSLSDGGFKVCAEKIRRPMVPLGWHLELTNFVGSCNGLFFMYMYNNHEKPVCLWNPCTNEIRYLPRSGFHGIEERAICAFRKGHGFGYDSKSDDYKYVRIFYYPSQREGSEVHVYSFRTNTWKQMYVPYVLTNVDSDRAPNGIFYNGALHWFAEKISSYCVTVLLAFDMTEESVREIPQPENPGFKQFGIKYIDVLNGCLCILCSNSAGFQVWLMNDYGMR